MKQFLTKQFLILILFLAYTYVYSQNSKPSGKSYTLKSAIIAPTITDDHIETFTVLCQVWGFLKYYHPKVTQGKFEWDYELFKILPLIYNKNKSERNKIILKWINSLGNYEVETDLGIKDSSIIKIFPDYNWLDPKILGNELFDKLTNLKTAKREGEQFYVAFDSLYPNAEFKHENAYKEIKYPDIGFQLVSLYRYWNIIQYFYPYKYLLKEDWNLVLKAFIPKFIRAKTELDYKMAVLELISKLDDAHAVMGGYEEEIEKFKGSNIAPLEVSLIEGKAVISGYLNDSLGKLSKLHVGDIIDSINNESIEKIINKKRTLFQLLINKFC